MIQWINKLDMPWRVTAWIVFFMVVIAVAWGATKLNKLMFKKLRSRREGIHLALFERISSHLIVIVCLFLAFSTFGGFQSIWQTMLGGTAIISAVLAFVAQDVIKDILAGIMISIHKPFEIGDRIVLEDGTAGIVETITLRHIVLIGVDTPRIVIPNSKINTMRLTNYSYQRPDRSAQFRFSVGYGSDMAQVKRVIAQAIEESAYSLPGKTDKDGNPAYGQVYFLAFADSALIMAVTVYYGKESRTEVVTDDINTRVREALIQNGIEIPYNYVNVVSVDEGQAKEK